MGSGNLATRLQNLGGELRQLEKELRELPTDADPAVVRDFREALDNLRLTAWSLQLWLEEKRAGRSTVRLMGQLTAERIRRTIQLSNNLVTDMDGGGVTLESSGVNDLYTTLKRLLERLKQLFGHA
ncbi:MAG: hypothetical protein ACRD4U_10780 [Candidatus Acidiferrales bacterium]